MFIRVVSPSRKGISKEDREAIFYLQQDNWNDFSFQTLYHLFLSGDYSDDGDPISVGPVKILKKGQTKKDGIQIPIGEFEQLSEDFCSLGQSLDYYERIAQLDESLKNKILHALRDVVVFPEYKSGFEEEAGWSISLLRDIKIDDDIFLLAPMLIDQNFAAIPSIDLKFEFTASDLSPQLIFDFDSPTSELFFYRNKLPNRIIVLVGNNGSGKSTLLSKISRVAFASTSDRNDVFLRKIGGFNPQGIGFPKILNISYSAFDSFQVPGIYLHEKEQISKEIRQNQGRYIFCGIRDICKELDEIKEKIEVDNRGKLTEKEILKDRQPVTCLKSIGQLASEYENLIQLIIRNGKQEFFQSVIDILSKEASFYQLQIQQSGCFDNHDLKDTFMSVGTGHKFVLHSVASIVAYTEPRTLILFDEPEIHLHPPLLAVLMSALRYVLEKKDAFSIVATHSPVVVQETLSRHVKIVRRSGAQLKIIKPEIQTFGENIGSITSHVFGLSTDVTDYHNEIDKVIQNIKSPLMPEVDNEDAIKNLEILFDGEISMQSRAYILSRLISKRPE